MKSSLRQNKQCFLSECYFSKDPSPTCLNLISWLWLSKNKKSLKQLSQEKKTEWSTESLFITRTGEITLLNIILSFIKNVLFCSFQQYLSYERSFSLTLFVHHTYNPILLPSVMLLQFSFILRKN